MKFNDTFFAFTAFSKLRKFEQVLDNSFQEVLDSSCLKMSEL